MEIPEIVGAGLIVIGAGLGIGRIGGSAMEAIGSSTRGYCENSNCNAYCCGSYRGYRFRGTFRSLRQLSRSGATIGCTDLFFPNYRI